MDETNGTTPILTSVTSANGSIEIPIARSSAMSTGSTAGILGIISGNNTNGNGAMAATSTDGITPASSTTTSATSTSSTTNAVDVQQQMIALQQAFQQKQADLLYHFQQSQAQLALQHYQMSQQVLRDAARRRQQLEQAAAAAAAAMAADRELQRIASDQMLAAAVAQQATKGVMFGGNHHHHQHHHHHGTNNGANLIGVSASEYDLSRGAAGGSGAISVRTREKLKAHLANKQRLRRRSTQSGSPHFEPYPIPSNCVVDDDPSSGASSADDYDLRKTRSEPNLKMLPPRGALHHHHNAAALRIKLHQQQVAAAAVAAGHHYDGSSVGGGLVRTLSVGGGGNNENVDVEEDGIAANTNNFNSAAAASAAAAVHQQQQAVAAAAALSALFSAPSMPNISAYHQNRGGGSGGLMGASLPTEPLSSAIGGPLFFSVPSMLPYLNAAALQQAAAAQAAAAAASGGGSPWQPQPGGRPLFDFAGGGGLVEGNRRTPTSAFTSTGHHGQQQQQHGGGGHGSGGGSSGGGGNGGSHGLLKQQLRDLLLRRRSLVPEETADELKSETSHNAAANFVGVNNRNAAAAAAAAAATISSLHQQAAASAAVGGGIGVGVGGLVQCSPKGTGLAYDNLMCKHQCICGDNAQHVEHGGRVQSIWARLQETGLADECEKISGRKAPIEYLKLCHGDSYTTFFAVSPSACLRFDANELPLKEFVQLPCGGIGVDSDTYFNDAFTPSAARLAVGCCVELCVAVAEGRLKNGFAIVRPPGHHAEPEQALGFCFFNNVAISAQVLRKKYGVRKVAIVDWDVHHGNGTQLIFEEDADVLYLSFHRHDNGNFFPGTGAITDVGAGPGRGATVNVAWSGESMGDAEYLAAWRVVAMPVLDRFQPEFVLVSAGFDAANGHRAALGGYKLSASLFGYFTKSLVTRYAGGKVVLVLEGGYDLAVISEAAEQCVRALKEASCGNVGGPVPSSSTLAELPLQSMTARPNASAQLTLSRVVEVQKEYWPNLSIDGALLSQSEWSSNLPRQFASLTMAGRQASSISMDEKDEQETGHNGHDEDERIDADGESDGVEDLVADVDEDEEIVDA